MTTSTGAESTLARTLVGQPDELGHELVRRTHLELHKTDLVTQLSA